MVVEQCRIEDVASLTAGAGHDEHLDALIDVAGHRGRTLTRLVVGMGVDGHQAQQFTRLGQVRRGRRGQGHVQLQGIVGETASVPDS